ncbi:MAG: hypothetical protein CO022_00770 [Flavobacteriales bacterium CG_4_9_14_0_2_um_filter_32_27]|nr:MAG: hypothetical protein CO022_00770 [Flavobacteriales bacterium CG_4_9_14_0_2_um_filter_32_27]
MSSKKEENIEFQLINIEILESEIKAPTEPLINNIVFSFDIALEQRFNVEQELIFVICDITVFPQANPEQKLGKYRSNCIFKVNNLNKYITDNKKVNLSDNFIVTINSVALSTTRGLMFSLFKGTFLQRAILPLLDPSQYKKERNKQKPYML